MMTRTVLLALVVGSTTLLGAQVPVVNNGVVRLSGGVHFSTGENVEITADGAEFDQKTGEVQLFGTVMLRQALRPATQQIAATNQAGALFPEPKQVMMRLSGNFQVSIGDLTVHAEEADFNGLTGEMTLRGNVRVTNPRLAGKQWFK